MFKRILIVFLATSALQGLAEEKGAITPEMLSGFKAAYEDNAANR